VGGNSIRGGNDIKEKKKAGSETHFNPLAKKRSKNKSKGEGVSERKKKN